MYLDRRPHEGMLAVPDTKMRMRRRAVRALMSHTQNAIRDLRNDEDEMLRGALFSSSCRKCNSY